MKLQPFLVEQFHEQGNGTADGALAMLVAADCAEVLNTETGCQLRLGEARPLADGFELRMGHLVWLLPFIGLNVLGRSLFMGSHLHTRSINSKQGEQRNGRRHKRCRGGRRLCRRGHGFCNCQRPCCSEHQRPRNDQPFSFSRGPVGQCPDALRDRATGPLWQVPIVLGSSHFWAATSNPA
jgi:hypothetical protein